LVSGSSSESQRRFRLSALIKRQPLAAFFVIALAITWAPTPLGIFLAPGPLLAALIVTAVVDGRCGLRQLGGRMLRWRVGWQWYAAAVLIPLAVVFASGGLTVALGGPGAAITELEVPAAVLLFTLRLVLPVFSPISEEPGWRGFALPRLLADRTPLVATAILGAIVALWHVPLIFIAGEDLPPIFLLATVAVTFFYSWLFVHTGGSVVITIVAHAAEGVIGRELTRTDGGFAGGDETTWIWLYTAGWCAVAICVVVFDWQTWRSRNHELAPMDDASLRPMKAAPALRPTG
jgi:membrane protease YdiL (CAAX protease family)